MRAYFVHATAVSRLIAGASILAMGVAVSLPAGAQSPAPLQAEPAPTLQLLRTPPKLDYAAICQTPLPSEPLAFDWHGWDGQGTQILAEQMLSDATRYAEGDRQVSRDKALARRMLEYLAAGMTPAAPEAKRQLALLLVDLEAGPVDPARAQSLLMEATSAQQTSAALTLGKLIRAGTLPNTNIADAALYLGIAASLGDPAAALQLAAIHAEPGAVPPFENAARHFMMLAAINVQTALAAGECDVANEVGDFLAASGDPDAQALAAAWYEVAASVREPRALARLARLYEAGTGKPLDLDQARKLWDMAAGEGLVRAIAPAARLYLVAGEKIDHAVELLKTGMASRDMDSFLLAARYYRGDYTGKADFAAMVETLEAAAALPDVSPLILDMLGKAHLAGHGVKPDSVRADELYRRLEATNTPEAGALYGRYMVDQGLGLKQAAGQFDRASALGISTAMFDLAELAQCVAGMGSAEEADRLLQQAADAGSTAAMRRLARYASDRGDGAAAAALLSRAVALGDRQAMADLAIMISASGGPVPEMDKLVKQAIAPGAGMIEGRLAIAIALMDGKLTGDAAQGRELLESISQSGQPAVLIEVVRQKVSASEMVESERQMVAEMLRSAAIAGNGEAMLLLSRMGTDAAAPTGMTPEEWLERAAIVGEPTALAELPADEPTTRRVLAGTKERLVCNVASLVQQARLHMLVKDESAAVGALSQAERIAAKRPRDLFYLAEAFATGLATGGADLARSAILYERSAKAGHIKAAVALGTLLASNKLGEREPEAIGWFRTAAISGEPAAIRALVLLAGQTKTPRNAGLAAAALEDAAESGVVAAMQAYGSLLAMRGPESRQQGIAYLEKAAGSGEVAAMKTLARLYAAGLSGAVSADESMRWTRMAAERGDPEAMFQYAMALDLGFGVAVDHQSAKAWHAKAKENGFVR